MITKIISIYIRYKLVKMFLKDTLHTDFDDDAIFIQSVVIFILTGKYRYGNLQGGTAVADATENNPDAITDFEKANRTAWDQVITGAGGTIMNTAAASATGDSYWASRETSSGTSAFYVRFGKPLAWDKSNAKKDGKRFVRAVRSISK